MAGWSVGLCVFGFFLFFNLMFWVETFSDVGGGILIKGSLCLPSGGGPQQVNHCICWMPTVPSSPPPAFALGLLCILLLLC